MIRIGSIMVAIVAACAAPAAGAAEHLAYEVVTATGSDADGVVTSEEMYVSAGHLVIQDARVRTVVTPDEMTVIDREYRTWFSTPLPFDPAAVLNEIGLLRHLNTDRIECEVVVHESATPAEPIDLRPMLAAFHAFTAPQCAGEHRNQDGIPMHTETVIGAGPNATRITKRAVERKRGPTPPELLVAPPGFVKKETITWNELMSGRAGPPPRRFNDREKAVHGVIDRFRDGCEKRDLSKLDAWIEELMADDVYIVGTDSRWPDSWEWRGGKDAAREMFARDWRRWGDVRIFDDEMHIEVEGNAAWVVAYATVTGRRTDDDLSRRRSISRIAEYTEKDWSSRRALYEIIADAGQVLVQYERGNEFITPMRAQFDLVKRESNWKIKMIHWSHPAYGFRSWRLPNSPDRHR